MKLTVTQENIDTALSKRSIVPNHGYFADFDCPVALALKALGYHNAWVGAYSLRTRARSTKLVHSKVLKAWINKFDVTRKATPRTFIVKGLVAA